ncbi:MAG: rRNA methyltransferase [Ruminiclostridium sp.]|nr:rRNA methyltransferase [Ruminiclostridium sp.]
MQFPEELRTAAEAYAESFDRKQLIKAASSVSEKYREERADGSRLVTAEAETAAYAVTRMPATFAAVSSALEHALASYGGSIISCADIGAGTGAAGWAAAMLIDGLETLDCFERVASMRTLGGKLMNEAEIPVKESWHDLDITNGVLPHSYDLITAAYVLNELTDAARSRAVTALWEKTDGMLLIVEPGTMTGYRNIMQARALLLSNGANIAHPCPSTAECPLPEGDWCHFTARAARSKLHKQLKGGDVPYEDEKYSCIAAVRGECTPCERRILRHPQVASGVITLHTCTASGVEDIKVTKSSKLFKAARKADCGDSI